MAIHNNDISDFRTNQGISNEIAENWRYLYPHQNKPSLVCSLKDQGWEAVLAETGVHHTVHKVSTQRRRMRDALIELLDWTKEMVDQKRKRDQLVIEVE